MNDYKKVRDLWFDISYFTVMDISTAAENLIIIYKQGRLLCKEIVIDK